MQFGVLLPQLGPLARGAGADERLRDVATAADRLGYDVVWTAEHLVLPDRIDTPYPYGSAFPFDRDDPILDVAATLSYVAALTARVRLGTAVIVLPYHHPIALAKALATVDVLSRGRLLVGVASGWLREEFEMLGVPFRERGARTDEYLSLLTSLWTEERVTFRGRFYSLSEAAFFPKPVQKPHPPLWMGGGSPAALRRVARSGDGWLATPGDRDRTAAKIQAMRREAERIGRDPADIGVASSGGARSVAELVDLVPALESIGVTSVTVPALFWAGSVPRTLELMEEFAERAGLRPAAEERSVP